jgi:hypothetical protein
MIKHQKADSFCPQDALSAAAEIEWEVRGGHAEAPKIPVKRTVTPVTTRQVDTTKKWRQPEVC